MRMGTYTLHHVCQKCHPVTSVLFASLWALLPCCCGATGANIWGTGVVGSSVESESQTLMPHGEEVSRGKSTDHMGASVMSGIVRLGALLLWAGDWEARVMGTSLAKEMGCQPCCYCPVTCGDWRHWGQEDGVLSPVSPTATSFSGAVGSGTISTVPRVPPPLCSRPPTFRYTDVCNYLASCFCWAEVRFELWVFY